MTAHRSAMLFLLALVVVIAAYDLAAYVWWGPSGTISRVLRQAGAQWHWLPWAVGVLFALLWLHLFAEDAP